MVPVMATLRYAFSSLLRSRDGVAATEFAFIAPIMVLLFVGVLEASDALTTSRKVTLSVNTLSDLVSQETTVTEDALDDLFVGMEDIIDSRDIAVDFRVVSLIVDPDTNDVVVHWSYDSAGSEPYAPGTAYTGSVDATLLDTATSLVVSEVSYAFTSKISSKLIPPVTLAKTAARWPRRSARVQLCDVSNVCTS
jgi:hypothetical protein